MDKKLAHEYNELIRNELINRRVGEPVNKKALDKLLDLFLKCNIESFYKFKSLKSSHTLTNFRDDIFHFSLVKDLMIRENLHIALILKKNEENVLKY